MGLGWSEMLVVAIVALLVFGPKELPAAARSLGRFLSEARRMSGEARRIFEDALRDAEDRAKRESVAGEAASARPPVEAAPSSPSAAAAPREG